MKAPIPLAAASLLAAGPNETANTVTMRQGTVEAAVSRSGVGVPLLLNAPNRCVVNCWHRDPTQRRPSQTAKGLG